MKFRITILNKEGSFKLNYSLEIEDTTIECIDRHFELCTDPEVALFFIRPPQVTRNVRGNIKMLLCKFTFKLNSDFQETNLYEELNLFRKKFP